MQRGLEWIMKVLIVEDERPINELIEMSLSERGYLCDCAYDGITAADFLQENSYDLVLLDIMLPGVDGYSLIEYIRTLDTPAIFITAKSSVEDRVKGLRMGADDYITKPFAIVELLARVETVLRRYNKGEQRYVVGDVTIDTVSRTVLKAGTPVELTLKEYELLLLFVRNRHIALFRETIFQRVWQSDYLGDTRTIDLHVRRLRKKLGWERELKTVYKIGYRLEI